MSCERELKYQLPIGCDSQDIFSHPCILPYLSGKTQKITMHSTYFDTRSGALGAMKSALRLRLENELPVVTLKTVLSINGAFSKRGEWEVSARSIAEALPQLAQAGAPGEILRELTGKELCVTAQFSFIRECVLLQCGDFSAHLCVDIGYLSPDGIVKTPLREVELELVSGDVNAMCAKGEALRAAFSMCAEPRSKLCRARGY